MCGIISVISISGILPSFHCNSLITFQTVCIFKHENQINDHKLLRLKKNIKTSLFHEGQMHLHPFRDFNWRDKNIFNDWFDYLLLYYRFIIIKYTINLNTKMVFEQVTENDLKLIKHKEISESSKMYEIYKF